MALRLVTKLLPTSSNEEFLIREKLTYFPAKSDFVVDIPSSPSPELITSLKERQAGKSLCINAEEEGGGSILRVVIICGEHGVKLSPYRRGSVPCGCHAYFSVKKLSVIVLERKDNEELPLLTVFSCSIDEKNFLVKQKILFSGRTNIYNKSIQGARNLEKKYYQAALAAIEKFKNDRCMSPYYIAEKDT